MRSNCYKVTFLTKFNSFAQLSLCKKNQIKSGEEVWLSLPWLLIADSYNKTFCSSIFRWISGTQTHKHTHEHPSVRQPATKNENNHGSTFLSKYFCYLTTFVAHHANYIPMHFIIQTEICETEFRSRSLAIRSSSFGTGNTFNWFFTGLWTRICEHLFPSFYLSCFLSTEQQFEAFRSLSP